MRGPVLAGRDQPRHHVQAAIAQPRGVFQRLVQPAPELVLPTGQRGDAALAGLPVAGRRVEQRLREAMRVQPRANLGGGMLVGKQELHRLEAIARGRGEAFQEGMFGVHHAEVCSQARHGDSLSV